jgi:cell division protein FtsB
MNTTPKTKTTDLIIVMEYWAKTVAKNGGVAAVTIQEGADRLRELETELAALTAERDQLRAEVERLESGLINQDLLDDRNEAIARAERAEAECLEQARLLGMSGSREASLLSKISQLEHQVEKNNS